MFNLVSTSSRSLNRNKKLFFDHFYTTEKKIMKKKWDSLKSAPTRGVQLDNSIPNPFACGVIVFSFVHYCVHSPYRSTEFSNDLAIKLLK